MRWVMWTLLNSSHRHIRPIQNTDGWPRDGQCLWGQPAQFHFIILILSVAAAVQLPVAVVCVILRPRYLSPLFHHSDHQSVTHAIITHLYLFNDTLLTHCKNMRIFTDILWRVFHILTETAPYTFLSVNRRNNKARAHIAVWTRA